MWPDVDGAEDKHATLTIKRDRTIMNGATHMGNSHIHALKHSLCTSTRVCVQIDIHKGVTMVWSWPSEILMPIDSVSVRRARFRL